MTPETDEKVRRWRMTTPYPEGRKNPEWLETCHCVGCRKNRVELGIVEREKK